MLEYVREGDTVIVTEYSRLARSTSDLLSIVEQLTEKGVRIVSVKENLDTSTPYPPTTPTTRQRRKTVVK